MPKAVSKRQWRFLQAVLHGKPKAHARGTPPKSIAAKYTGPGKDAPEQSGSNTGGDWTDEHHKRHEEREGKKKKKDLKKSEPLFKGKGAGVVLLNERGQVLIGKQRKSKEFTLPGGHVDGKETYEQAALRELEEETGLKGTNPTEIGAFSLNGNDNKVFVVDAWKGAVKDCDEVKNWSFMDVDNAPFDSMRPCALRCLKLYVDGKISKSRSLVDMLTAEKLEKNIIRQRGDAVFEVTHGDALRLVGNGAFRWLRGHVKDMKDEDFKDIHLDNYVIAVRKHMNDVYSGRVNDGHKTIYQFTHQSLPHLTAALMSVFEWYLPEDEAELELLDEDKLPDDMIHGGFKSLIDNYKKHNLSEIYEEMENIRSEVRNGVAIDLQQVEARMMTLFDRMEEFIQDLAGKHNKLANSAGGDIDEIEKKLLEIKAKIDELGNKPDVVEAFAQRKPNGDKILDEFYCYLSKPQIEIEPTGKIRITFGKDWTELEKENLLQDMKAKIIKKTRS